MRAPSTAQQALDELAALMNDASGVVMDAAASTSKRGMTSTTSTSKHPKQGVGTHRRKVVDAEAEARDNGDEEADVLDRYSRRGCCNYSTALMRARTQGHGGVGPSPDSASRGRA